MHDHRRLHVSKVRNFDEEVHLRATCKLIACDCVGSWSRHLPHTLHVMPCLSTDLHLPCHHLHASCMTLCCGCRALQEGLEQLLFG